MKALFDTHTIQRPNLYRSKTNTLAETWICYTCNILPLYVISKKKRREPWHIPLLLGSLHTFCPVSYPTQRESSQRCGSKIATKKLMIYSSQLEILTEDCFAFAHLLFEKKTMQCWGQHLWYLGSILFALNSHSILRTIFNLHILVILWKGRFFWWDEWYKV